MVSAAEDIGFADDGTTVVLLDPTLNQIGLWDVSSQKLIQHIGNPNKGKPKHFAYNTAQNVAAYAIPSGRYATRSRVDLVDTVTGKVLQVQGCHGHERIAFSRAGTSLLIGSYNGWLESWRIQGLNARQKNRFASMGDYAKDRVNSGTICAIEPIDSDWALVAGTDGVIAIYNFGQKPPPAQIAEGSTRAVNIAASPDFKHLAWVGSDGRVRLVDYADGRLLDKSKEISGFPSVVVFSPCGEFLAVQSNDLTVHCWDVSRQSLRSLGSRPFG